MFDVIIFMVDGKIGFIDVDREVVNMFRILKKLIVFVVNKIDNIL